MAISFFPCLYIGEGRKKIMEEEIAKLGYISKTTLKILKIKGDKLPVYVLTKTLDQLANQYPNDYLVKIAEAKRIVSKPMYGYFDKRKNSLFLLKEYIRGPTFVKVAVEIDLNKQAHMTALFTLSSKKSEEIIGEKGQWILLH